MSFTRRDTGPGTPAAVVTAADGTFRQRGFEIGGSLVARVTRLGFVGATLIGLFGILVAPLATAPLWRSPMIGPTFSKASAC